MLPEKVLPAFTLTNTNKLLRSYDGCKGLKTGSTSLAKYCLSAVAEKNGIDIDCSCDGGTGSQNKIAEMQRHF